MSENDPPIVLNDSAVIGIGVPEGCTFDHLTATAIDSIIADTFDPLLRREGFTRRKGRSWVRPHGPGMRGLFELHGSSGCSWWLYPSWGLSFDFVPHFSGGKMVWHRTDKGARMDLVHEQARFDPDRRAWEVRSSYGEGYARQTAASVASRAVPLAVGYFQRASSLEDVLTLMAWQRSLETFHGGVQFDHYLQHGLTEAFVHAALGQEAQGRSFLAHWLDTTGVARSWHVGDHRRPTYVREDQIERLWKAFSKLATSAVHPNTGEGSSS